MATRPEITKLSPEIDFWKILLYADSGSGKTVFVGADKKVIFLDPDKGGTVSAARFGSSASKITVKVWEDIKNAYEWFEAHPEELKDFEVFAIDSLTEMQNMAKNYVLRMTAEEKIRKNQDPTKMHIQDYGIMHDLLETMVRAFNDLPINVLWTATAKQVEDQDKNPFLVPEIQGKGGYGVAMKIVSLMTSYGYMRVELHDVPAPTEENPDNFKQVKRRVIYWEDTGTIRGKDRTRSLAPFTVNANLLQVRLAIAGKLTRNSEGKLVPLEDVAGQPESRVKMPVIKKAVEEKLPENTHNPETGEKLPEDIESEEVLDIVEA